MDVTRKAETEVIELDVEDIRTDGGTQSRSALNQDVVAEYAAAMSDNLKFPPLDVFYDGEAYWLADGFHRLEAAGLADLNVVDVTVHQGTLRDAILYSVGANTRHGLRRTNEDKRRAVMRLLADGEWSKWSNRAIAARCGVDESTVRKYREESGAGIPQVRQGTDGKTYDTTNIGQQPAATPPALPADEDLQRILTAVAVERQPVVWRMALAEAEGGQVTADALQALIDQLLGNIRRFEVNKAYPVHDSSRRVFNAPSTEPWKDLRFRECRSVDGARLNGERQYDAYSLVEVPDMHPQDMAAAIPSLAAPDHSGDVYPVDRDGQIIYDAPFEGESSAPQSLYADCKWVSSYDLKRLWYSVLDCLGEYHVLPARPLSNDWVTGSKFQPGMSAKCPKCFSVNWLVSSSVAPYEAWTPVEPGFWCCAHDHRVADDALDFNLEIPTRPSTGGSFSSAKPRTPEQIEAERLEQQARQKKFDIENILDLVGSITDLLVEIEKKPDLVREALSNAQIAAYQDDGSYDLSDEAITYARGWLAATLDDETLLDDSAWGPEVKAEDDPDEDADAAPDEDDDTEWEEGQDADIDDDDETE